MKRYTLFLLLLLLILPLSISQAQEPATAVDSLIIDFWPDYDQPSVLVLISGTFPAGTALPATVAIPLPEDAQLNAVAYVNNAGAMMNADRAVDNGLLTLTTPNLNFRVEYYLPYAVEGQQHAFAFNWLSDMEVNQVEAKVQQPIAASAFTTEPPAANIVEGDDGFVYHIFPSQSIPAGQSYTINVRYDMTTSQLSVEGLSDATIDLQPAGPVSVSDPTPEFNWPLIAGVAGGVLVVAALALLYFGNRPKERVGKPRPVRQVKKGAAHFCHNCGESLKTEDRFCRHCGTPVKER